MVTDGDLVGILAKVVNNVLSNVEGFLAVGNPVLTEAYSLSRGF